MVQLLILMQIIVGISGPVYNHGHNFMKIYDVLPNFPFTTSEMKPDY